MDAHVYFPKLIRTFSLITMRGHVQAFHSSPFLQICSLSGRSPPLQSSWCPADLRSWHQGCSSSADVAQGHASFFEAVAHEASGLADHAHGSQHLRCASAKSGEAADWGYGASFDEASSRLKGASCTFKRILAGLFIEIEKHSRPKFRVKQSETVKGAQCSHKYGFREQEAASRFLSEVLEAA